MEKIVEGHFVGTSDIERRPLGRVGAHTKRVYQLKVSLTEGNVEIWRRVLISGDTSLFALNEIIETLMLWEGFHIHQFVIEGVPYGIPDIDEEARCIDERQFCLNQVVPVTNASFSYLYDRENDWIHRIVVENITNDDERFSGRPVCIGGSHLVQWGMQAASAIEEQDKKKILHMVSS